MNAGNAETYERLIISEKVLKINFDVGKFTPRLLFCVKTECLFKKNP